jgi:exopolyphosphatase/pppGpp-phosphohydrolase
MRIGVLDIGSNSVHLMISDVQPGGSPHTVTSVKHRTRPAEAIDNDGAIAEDAVDRLVAAVVDAVDTARSHGLDELVTFATSATRGATNRRWITRACRWRPASKSATSPDGTKHGSRSWPYGPGTAGRPDRCCC